MLSFAFGNEDDVDGKEDNDEDEDEDDDEDEDEWRLARDKSSSLICKMRIIISSDQILKI